MRFPSNRLYLLFAVLVVLAAIVINGCSSGGGTNSLFGGGTSQGAFVGASEASSGGTAASTWNVTIDHNANTFTAENVTAGKHYSGSVSTPLSGFLETTTMTSDDAGVPPGTVGHSVEIPGSTTAVALHINDADNASKVVPLVNTGGVCPTLSSPLNFTVVQTFLPSGWNSTTDKAYETGTLTQTGTGTYTVSNSMGFRLDGTPVPETGNPLTCSNGFFPATSQNDSTFAVSFNKLIAIGTPTTSTSKGFIGIPTPSGPVSIAAVVGASYHGMIFKPNNVLQLVGFGPGAASTITGGTFTNVRTDPFAAHANNITIHFSAGPSNGFLTGSVVDGNGTHTPIIAEVGTAGGKFFIFLLYTDTSSTTPAFILLRQL
jgi:hypothetical protein